MKHILPTETINKIVSYLTTKAYCEVVHLINEISQKAQAFIEPEPKAPEACAPCAEEKKDVPPVAPS